MSNFLMKSKDMYFSDRERFGTFKDVFDAIEEVSFTKNYFDANLFNIEEILSILEMQELVESGRLKRGFVHYILDVIKHYTPPVRDPENSWGKLARASLFRRQSPARVRLLRRKSVGTTV